ISFRERAIQFVRNIKSLNSLHIFEEHMNKGLIIISHSFEEYLSYSRKETKMLWRRSIKSIIVIVLAFAISARMAVIGFFDKQAVCLTLGSPFYVTGQGRVLCF